jgi:putative nucleotidyltransferase with HDIG domain
MITNDEIKKWQFWLKDYVQQHYSNDLDIDSNIDMKYQHCLKVANESKHIALSLNMNPSDCNLAYLCGLFHDIGRFRQYKVYQTFSDSKSIYHGALGVEVLEKLEILDQFSRKHARIIQDSVYNHGLLAISDTLKEDSIHYTKIVRDADKLDIYRIVCNYYNSNAKRNVALELSLDVTENISEKVLNDFENGLIIQKSDMVFLNDFKILQLSWIFDIQFDYTRTMIAESNYIKCIIESISGQNNILKIKNIFDKNLNI